MRTTVMMIMFCTFWLNMAAQAPQSFTYQAVVRDLSGELLSSNVFSFRISILEETATGLVAYSEVHPAIPTDEFGLVEIQIEMGIPVVGMGQSGDGTFSAMRWVVDIG